MTSLRDAKRMGITLVGVMLLFVAIFAASYAVAHQEHQHHAQAVLIQSERAAPFQTLSYLPTMNHTALPLGRAGTTGGNGTSGGGPGGGSGTGSGTGTGAGRATGQSDLGLSCILDGLTSILGNLGILHGNPMGALNGLIPTLSGVVADVTGTLSNLTALLSTSGLPTTGAVPVTGSVPALTGGRSGVPGQGAGGLNPVLNGIAAVAGSTGSTTPSLPPPLPAAA